MNKKKIAKRHGKPGLLERTIAKSAELARCAVKGKNPDKAVLRTQGEMAFFEKGVTTWKLDLTHKKPLIEAATKTPHVSVRAEWHDAQQALEKGIEVLHGGRANTFGSMGALLVPDGFRIPVITATQDNVRHYGLQLIDDQTVFSVTSREHQIVMMRYEYSDDYKKDYLMQKRGGGGIFVETHAFPHIHVPLSRASHGCIVIGKQVTEETYHFTAFEIPYGQALYTPANTIHGDGTLVGEYGIALADSALATADTVLIYNKRTLSMARHVVPNGKS